MSSLLYPVQNIVSELRKDMGCSWYTVQAKGSILTRLT